METRDARALVMALGGIPAGPALDACVAERLAALEPHEAARVVDALARRDGVGDDERARKVIDAAARALAWGEPTLPIERRRAIRVAASSLALQAATALFSEAAPLRTKDDDAGPRRDAELGGLTLGHRKQLARTERAPDRVRRLALDDDPRVIAELLLNPRVTEPLVVAIAARRPVPVEVLRQVIRSPRWGVRRLVRRALALNPYSPPSLVNPLLAQLDATDLREVAASTVLHPAVRDAARSLAHGRLRP